MDYSKVDKDGKKLTSIVEPANQKYQAGYYDYWLEDPSKYEPTEEDIDAALNGLELIEEAMLSGSYDIVIADEANCAVKAGLFDVRRLLDLSDRGLAAVWRFGAALDWLAGRSIIGSNSVDGCTGHLDALEFAARSPQLADRSRQAINAVRNGQGVRANY